MGTPIDTATIAMDMITAITTITMLTITDPKQRAGGYQRPALYRRAAALRASRIERSSPSILRRFA